MSTKIVVYIVHNKTFVLPSALFCKKSKVLATKYRSAFRICDIQLNSYKGCDALWQVCVFMWKTSGFSSCDEKKCKTKM
jgi:hypothetical protein